MTPIPLPRFARASQYARTSTEGPLDAVTVEHEAQTDRARRAARRDAATVVRLQEGRITRRGSGLVGSRIGSGEASVGVACEDIEADKIHASGASCISANGLMAL